MKRTLALLLCFLLLLPAIPATAAVPEEAQAYLDEVYRIFPIDQSLYGELEYSQITDDLDTWHSFSFPGNDDDLPYIQVTLHENGSRFFFKGHDNHTLPLKPLSDKILLQKAQAYLDAHMPEIWSYVETVPEVSVFPVDAACITFSYPMTLHGYPIHDQFIVVTLDRYTGELLSYSEPERMRYQSLAPLAKTSAPKASLPAIRSLLYALPSAHDGKTNYIPAQGFLYGNEPQDPLTGNFIAPPAALLPQSWSDWDYECRDAEPKELVDDLSELEAYSILEDDCALAIAKQVGHIPDDAALKSRTFFFSGHDTPVLSYTFFSDSVRYEVSINAVTGALEIYSLVPEHSLMDEMIDFETALAAAEAFLHERTAHDQAQLFLKPVNTDPAKCFQFTYFRKSGARSVLDQTLLLNVMGNPPQVTYYFQNWDGDTPPVIPTGFSRIRGIFTMLARIPRGPMATLWPTTKGTYEPRWISDFYSNSFYINPHYDERDGLLKDGHGEVALLYYTDLLQGYPATYEKDIAWYVNYNIGLLPGEKIDEPLTQKEALSIICRTSFFNIQRATFSDHEEGFDIAYSLHDIYDPDALATAEFVATAIHRIMTVPENSWQLAIDIGLFAPDTDPQHILTGKDVVEVLLHIVDPL